MLIEVGVSVVSVVPWRWGSLEGWGGCSPGLGRRIIFQKLEQSVGVGKMDVKNN